MPRPAPDAATGSVLVYVGLDATGDGLIKLPFVRGLRALFPAARITWLAGKGPSAYRGALAPLVHGLLDEVLDHQGDGPGLGSRVAELIGPKPLGGRAFDLVIDTQRRLLTTLIVRRIPHRRFVSAAGGFRLSDARPATRGKPAAMAAQLAQLAETAAGRPLPPLLPALPADPAADAEARHLLPPGPVYVGLAPGAGGRHKCWPLARYLWLGAGLAERGMVPVLFLGPAELDWQAEIRARLPQALMPLQQAGAITPMLTIALARRLAAAIANDSGTGHLLAAADIPLVSLFGPTPAEKFAPGGVAVRVVRAQTFGGDTMESIPEPAVRSALAEALGDPLL